MAKRKAPREGSFALWLSKRLDWPNDKILQHAERAGFPAKTKQRLHHARHQLRAQYGLGAPADPTKSHPKKKPPPPKKKPKSTTTKSTKTKSKLQPTALQLKLSHLRKLVFEVGWDAARDVFHEFEATYSRWGGR